MTSPSSAAAVSDRSTIDGTAETLACLTTGGAIGDFLRHRAPGLIVDLVAPALADDVGPLHCTVTRSKLKPGRRLTVSADIRGPGLDPRPVTAIWGTPPAAVQGALAGDVPAGARGPFASLHEVGRLGPGGGLTVLISPLDPGFPALAALHDPRRAAQILRSRGIAVSAAEVTVRTLRYRPGQRHVLRLDLAGAGRATVGRSVFAKCYRDDTGARAAEAVKTIGTALRESGGRAGVVRPVGYVATDRLMLWEGSPGVALSAMLGGRSDPVRTAGGVLRAIHDSAVDGPDRGRPSSPDAEAVATLRSCEHVMALLPDRAAALRESVSRVAAALIESRAETGHRLHGDYKLDNLLVEGDRLRVLDLDRVTVGDPALDLGKLTADLRWWAATRGVDPEPAVAAFLEGYGECPRERLRRALSYEALFMLRSVGRRIPLHEKGWDVRVDRMLAAAVRGGEQ